MKVCLYFSLWQNYSKFWYRISLDFQNCEVQTTFQFDEFFWRKNFKIHTDFAVFEIFSKKLITIVKVGLHSNYPINSKITRGLNFFFLPKIAGYFRVRIIFECGLNSFFLFFWPETNAYSSIKEFIMVISLSAVVRVSKYSKSLSQNSDTPANAVNICKIHKIFSDNNRVRIKIECGLNSFFLPKIADYNRVRIIIECGLFSS